MFSVCPSRTDGKAVSEFHPGADVDEENELAVTDMADQPIPAALEKAKQRHLLPGAATSFEDFRTAESYEKPLGYACV